jgi:hypothetical protein
MTLPYNQLPVGGKKSLQYPVSQQFNFDIASGNKFGRYSKISSQEFFNMMVSDGALVPYAGHTLVAQIANGNPGRGIWFSTITNKLYTVVESGFYSVDLGTFFVNKIATISSSSGQVYISENLGSQIAIVDGTKNVYVFNYSTNTFSVTVVDFLAVYLSFQDTYFIAADGLTNEWRLSNNNDGTVWPDAPENVGLIQTAATTTVATVALDRLLFIFGQTFCEIWYDQGTQSLFPYQRINYLSIPYGCVNAASIAAANSRLVWIGTNKNSEVRVLMSQGGQAQPVSNDGLNARLSKLTTPNDCVGNIYNISGHTFYHFTFLTDNQSYTIDLDSGNYYTLTDEKLDAHILRNSVVANNNVYFVSNLDGNLYQMDQEVYNYNGKLIPRILIFSHLRIPNADRAILNNMSYTMEQGLTQTIQEAHLSISRDGGLSYGNIVVTKLNPLGKRQNILQFYNFGALNDLTVKNILWGNGRFVITGITGTIYQ